MDQHREQRAIAASINQASICTACAARRRGTTQRSQLQGLRLCLLSPIDPDANEVLSRARSVAAQ